MASIITNEKLQKMVARWAEEIGQDRAEIKLKENGVGYRLARYLITGTYNKGLSLDKANKILRAMR